MEKLENSKRHTVLRSAEPCGDNCQSTANNEGKQRFHSESNSNKRTKRDKKDRKSSTTHDGKGSEMF